MKLLELFEGKNTLDQDAFGAWIDIDEDEVYNVIDDQQHWDIAGKLAAEFEPDWENTYRNIYDWAYDNNMVRLNFQFFAKGLGELGIEGKYNAIKKSWKFVRPIAMQSIKVYIDLVSDARDPGKIRYMQAGKKEFEPSVDRSALIQFFE